jgi:hypothetical protein
MVELFLHSPPPRTHFYRFTFTVVPFPVVLKKQTSSVDLYIHSPIRLPGAVLN